MNEVIEFIEKKTPIIERELNDLKHYVQQGGVHNYSILTLIINLETRLQDFEAIKKMLTN